MGDGPTEVTGQDPWKQGVLPSLDTRGRLLTADTKQGDSFQELLPGDSESPALESMQNGRQAQETQRNGP